MDTRVWLLEKYFPLMLQTPLLLLERRKCALKEKQMQREECLKINANTRMHKHVHFNGFGFQPCNSNSVGLMKHNFTFGFGILRFSFLLKAQDKVSHDPDGTEKQRQSF